jgi:hypothetical protein
MNYRFCIIGSSIQNVPLVNELLGAFSKIAHWYVGQDEGDKFKEAGAAITVEVPGPWIKRRNRALHDSFVENNNCIQITDDVVGFYSVLKRGNQFFKKQEDLQVIVNSFDAYMLQIPQAHLYSMPINSMLTSIAGRFIINRLIPSNFFIARPSPVRFDEQLQFKEEYDFTLQHIKKYGVVVLCEMFMVESVQRKAALETIARDTKYLKGKWKEYVKDDVAIPNNILLNLP